MDLKSLISDLPKQWGGPSHLENVIGNIISYPEKIIHFPPKKLHPSIVYGVARHNFARWEKKIHQ